RLAFPRCNRKPWPARCRIVRSCDTYGEDFSLLGSTRKWRPSLTVSREGADGSVSLLSARGRRFSCEGRGPSPHDHTAKQLQERRRHILKISTIVSLALLATASAGCGSSASGGGEAGKGMSTGGAAGTGQGGSSSTGGASSTGGSMGGATGSGGATTGSGG